MFVMQSLPFLITFNLVILLPFYADGNAATLLIFLENLVIVTYASYCGLMHLLHLYNAKYSFVTCVPLFRIVFVDKWWICCWTWTCRPVIKLKFSTYILIFAFLKSDISCVDSCYQSSVSKRFHWHRATNQNEMDHPRDRIWQHWPWFYYDSRLFFSPHFCNLICDWPLMKIVPGHSKRSITLYFFWVLLPNMV